MLEGTRLLIAGMIGGTRFVFARCHLIEAEQPATGRVLHQLVILLDGHAQPHGNVGGSRVLPLGVLDLAHHVRHLAHVSMHRTRRPVGLSHFVEHGPANPNARIGLEIGALGGGIVLRGIQQADHPGLNQIVDLHIRRHAADQVIGDAFDQIGMPQDQFLLRHLIDGDVIVRKRFRAAFLRIRVLCACSHCNTVEGPIPAPTMRSTKNSR